MFDTETMKHNAVVVAMGNCRHQLSKQRHRGGFGEPPSFVQVRHQIRTDGIHDEETTIIMLNGTNHAQETGMRIVVQHMHYTSFGCEIFVDTRGGHDANGYGSGYATTLVFSSNKSCLMNPILQIEIEP